MAALLTKRVPFRTLLEKDVKADRDASFSTLYIYRKDDTELSIADGSLVSDGSVYNKSVHWRGRTESVTGFVKSVSHIAYCDFFDPTEANAWQQICIDFVHSVRTFMPKLLHKQKVRYLLHLVERMKNYGPSSTFSAELNKQAPSRDNANHFAIVEHLHYICNGCYYDSNERCSKGLQDLYSSDQAQHGWQLPTMVHSMHSRSIVLQRMELEQQDPPFGIIVQMGVMDGDIHQYRAVVSQSSELVHSGDYVKLHPSFCQFTYGQLVATIKPKSEHTLCLVQGFETFKLSNGQQCLNNVEHCSL
ncbi:hypothetical protein EMCRGX_G010549 [Ephydatia muelleri]